MGERWPVGGRGPLLIGAAAFIIVLIQVIQPPPVVHGEGLRTGAWLALVASALLAGAGWLASGGKSRGQRRPAGGGEAPGRTPPPPPPPQRERF